MTICSGIFLLSRIGLTQGHTITTHWQFIAQLKAETSSETIEENVLYCRDRQIMSSAGSAAGIDLGLEIARQDYGTETANRMAQRLVLPAHRAGGQKQFVPRPIAAPQKGQLAAYLDHVRQKLDEPWPIKKLANLCHMSERTLMRRFQEIVGLSPSQWLNRERIYFARSLLEKDHFTMDEIAQKAGFNTPETMRHHFRTQLNISPAHYRNQFMAIKKGRINRPLNYSAAAVFLVGTSGLVGTSWLTSSPAPNLGCGASAKSASPVGLRRGRRARGARFGFSGCAASSLAG